MRLGGENGHRSNHPNAANGECTEEASKGVERLVLGVAPAGGRGQPPLAPAPISPSSRTGTHVG